MPTLKSKVINNPHKTIYLDLKDSSSGRFVQFTAQCNHERQRITLDLGDLSEIIETLVAFARTAGVELPSDFKAADIDRIKRDHPRAYSPWTQEELQLLKQEIADGKTVDQIANYHQRQPSAIHSRMRALQPT